MSKETIERTIKQFRPVSLFNVNSYSLNNNSDISIE